MAALNFRLDDRITEQQRQFLRDFCLQEGGEIISLANQLGIKVFAEELWPYESGFLEYAPTCGSASNYRIVVNSRHPVERQRFTVAHEMGHFLLHHEDDDFTTRSEVSHRSDDFFEYLDADDPVQEREANGLAAALLMPPNLFRPAFFELLGDARALATRFGVSEVAVKGRIRELRLDQ
jgi:Zn-dependent peptidase ImmA (M78 family)